MADVQIEKGYTKIANEILDTLAKQPLNGTQRRILDVIFRYTYGYNRKEHELSLSFISNATMCDKRQIQRELKNLETKGIIHQRTGAKRIISFNKDYEQWVGEDTIGKNTIGETTNGRTHNISIGEITNSTIGESTNQERNNKNKNKKDIYKPIYEEVINYLNLKCNSSYKVSTKSTQSLIKVRLKEGYNIDDFKNVIDKKYISWSGTTYEQYLRPSTLFGNKFESYINEKNIQEEITTNKSRFSGAEGVV